MYYFLLKHPYLNTHALPLAEHSRDQIRGIAAGSGGELGGEQPEIIRGQQARPRDRGPDRARKPVSPLLAGKDLSEGAQCVDDGRHGASSHLTRRAVSGHERMFLERVLMLLSHGSRCS
jgi:hypothetical protein